MNIQNKNIIPISFSIPDECVVNSIPNKETILASLIPGNMSTYVFGVNDEKKYYDMYKKARFALTTKKGGWDCLRHYEILMNGCIPLFENLKECPDYTMTTYPKHLNDDAYKLYNNWEETEEKIEAYNNLCTKFIDHTRNFCTVSYAASTILNSLNKTECKNILLIRCHEGFNYARECTWIGLKRYAQSIGGTAVEYPKIDILYEDYEFQSNSKPEYTYPKRLKPDSSMEDTEIINKINNHFWDIIVYGKVGPDEYCDFPLFNIVLSKYSKDEVVFIYGGDEIFNLKVKDRKSYHVNIHGCHIPYYPYNDYLYHYSQFGKSFVRELEM